MFLALLEYVTQEGQSNFSDVFKISSQRTEIKSSLEKKLVQCGLRTKQIRKLDEIITRTKLGSAKNVQ